MSNYLEPEVERAAYEYLVANLPDWLSLDRIYKGVDNPEEESLFNRPRNVRRYPCVVLQTESAEPVLPNYQGMWEVRLGVEIWNSRYDVTDFTHRDRCRDIIDRFLTKSIAPDLAAAYANAVKTEQFFVRRVIPGPRTIRAEGKGWCTSQAIDFKECGHLSADQLTR